MDVNQPVHALILSISEENGLEYLQLFDKSVNAPKFKQYLLNLRNNNQFQRIAIFLDNLSVHKAKSIKKCLEQ